MRLQLSLLLVFAALLAAEASVRPSYASRQMLQETCPIQFCKTGRDCIYASRTKKWTCKACEAPRIPNSAKNECVCPAGMFPTAGGGCSECRMNMFCPRGQSALRSTAQSCPANMVTLKRGAKSINECFNAPGYFYRKTSGGVRAVPCPVDTWTTGLKKQTVCTACLTGFKTDPETVPGSFTSSDVCVAPAGSFVTGTTVTLCPKGEYNDEYSMATSCQTCEDKYGTGITTPREGSTNVSACFHLEPGFALVNDKNRVFLNPIDLINTPYVGAKPCPQNYYCPGGDPTLASGAAGSGTPVKCPHNMWTETEGAKSEDECVAPPGMYLPDGVLTARDKEIKDCPQGTYKETWQRIGISGCQPCGIGLWLSDKTIFLNDLDPNTGLVRRQIGVRGSSDSCYIQRGMGAVQVRNQTSQDVVLQAIVCPVNYYGVVGVPVVDDSSTSYKKYGKVASSCTQCPTNMITDGNDTRIISIMIKSAADPLGLELDDEGVTTGGYYSVEACFNQPGYGYTQGASQLCPLGYYNAGFNKLPCTECPFGTTTLSTSIVNDAEADCTMYIAGYGNLTDIPQLCPVGTYSVLDTPKGTPCTACPATYTTADVGSNSAAKCDVCAAGYGQIALNTTCQSCQNGYYGPSGREDDKCLRCPTGRTFSYDWMGKDDVFVPETTSKPNSDSQADCVADFSQTVDGAFYLDLVPKIGVYSKVPGNENLQSCVQNCRTDANCLAATFDYNSLDCWTWTPNTTFGSFVANGGVAFKLISSTNLAASEDAAAKEMGSGEYNFIPDGQRTPAQIASGSLEDNAATTLKDCQTACSQVNLCSGIAFGKWIPATDAVASCQLIKGTSLPGSSLRTLIKANFLGLNTDLRVAPGFYSIPGTTTVQICAEDRLANSKGFYCPGGSVGAAPRVQCASDNGDGAYTEEAAYTSAQCGARLMPGYYYDKVVTGSVKPCKAGYYCLGGEDYKTPTPSADVGASLCPDGTTNTANAANSGPNTCTTLLVGFHYVAAVAGDADAPANIISTTTVRSCGSGSYCPTDTIIVGTSSTNFNSCPPGTTNDARVSPTAGFGLITECTTLLAGWQYDSTDAISATTITTCPMDKYCPGATIVSGTAEPSTWCPAGSGTSTTGSTSITACTKLYPGYYYTGIGTTISRTNVLPCPDNSFCPGGTITIGDASPAQACPAGTEITAAAHDADTANRAPSDYTGSHANAMADCTRLVAGYYFTGANAAAISASTVLECPIGSYCAGTAAISAAVPAASCPTGTTTQAKLQNEVNDCNKLVAGYYYDKGSTAGDISATADQTVFECLAGSWCPGGNIIDVGVSNEVGKEACPNGALSPAVKASSINQCTDLQANYYYTGTGDLSNDNVVVCEVGFYCLGTATLTPNNGMEQGRAQCATGSTTASTGSGIADDCAVLLPGYYFRANVTGSGSTLTYADGAITICDVPAPDSICVGGATVSAYIGDVGRQTCTAATSALSPFCTVTAFVKCDSTDDCSAQ